MELGLNKIFRSRWGVAIVIVVIVLAVVVLGRLFSSGNDDNPVVGGGGSPPAVASVNPSDDDGDISSEAPPTPSTGLGKAQPEAVAYAFASAWIDKKVSAKTWRDQLLPNSTQKLADELKGVDPASVPADRVIGRPTVAAVNSNLVTAVVTMDSGKLSLRLTAPEGQWLVDAIDWDPA
jgi:hypothetical protein